MPVKTLNMFGNCQTPVFSLNVSQHVHKITNLRKFELNRSSKLLDNNERGTPLSHGVVCFGMLDFETSKFNSDVSKSNSWKITSFSKTTSLQAGPPEAGGDVSHNISYYQLSITRYQVRFYANYSE